MNDTSGISVQIDAALHISLQLKTTLKTCNVYSEWRISGSIKFETNQDHLCPFLTEMSNVVQAF